MVLQEHNWDVEEALQVLQMFSESGVNHLKCLNLTIFLTFYNF